MVLFKVNGERNSGTTFLTDILMENEFPVYINGISENFFHWKHSIPKPDIKNVDDKVVDLFIFRNLDDWLVSMYKNPYNLIRSNTVEEFLTKKQRSNNLVPYNRDDNGKTIFEIRYYKFQKIMEYAKSNNDVIFVNLEYLQSESNLFHFFQHLNSTYLNRTRSNYITKIPHTKNGKLILNREYEVDINLFKPIIDQYKNNEIESFIKNLKMSSNRTHIKKKRFTLFPKV
jgi:hypothetical protein